MARGSISNTGNAVLVLLLGLTCFTAFVRGKEWIVGDDMGWRANLTGMWPGGRPIRASDVLVFNYAEGAHNVVEVDEAGYNACAPGAGAQTYSSGNDRIMLPEGTSFFICSFPGHCDSGMKLAVTAQE